MNFEEYAAKPLLAAAGIPVPPSEVAETAAAAGAAAGRLGAVMVKAQVPTGKRGKAGGIKPASTPGEAESVASAILGMSIAGHPVEKVLVEQQAAIVSEYYAAVLNDPAAESPRVIFSPAGGMDIEEIARDKPDALVGHTVDIRHGFDKEAADAMLVPLDLGEKADPVANLLVQLYAVYAANDGELLEINPLAVLEDQSLLALDCKFVLDDSAIKRQGELSQQGTPDRLTGLEEQASQHGLKYIELDGDVGVLANGAGLTMTTMDVISHLGGKPANFLEIGGEAYTLAQPALELVLANAKVKSLVVNFCGAFARTDVMMKGVLDAWEALKPDLPVYFSVHGTGAAEAIAMLKERLGEEPYPTMDGAIAGAIAAARGEASA